MKTKKKKASLTDNSCHIFLSKAVNVNWANLCGAMKDDDQTTQDAHKVLST